jgi:hypothetical protein
MSHEEWRGFVLEGPRTEEYGARNGVAGELLVTVTQARIVARGAIAD